MGHTIPLSSYVLRETKSLDRVPLGSLQKCGNITTPAGLMWLSPLVFCFGYMPGLLLVCCHLASISGLKQPAHAGLTITKTCPYLAGFNSG